MAAPLRYPLILLAWGTMAAIYLPLFPAAAGLVWPALSSVHWRALFADPQLGQARSHTLLSSRLSVGGPLLRGLPFVASPWPSARWRRPASRLPLLLAVPHLALATAALLLFAEGGWIWQRLPFLTPPVDRYGIGLGLTMALKESAFVLWVIYGLLGEARLADQATALKSLGYGRWQCLRWLVLPALLRAFGMVLLAAAAWSLSTVDVALFLFPCYPPTLPVLACQFFSHFLSMQHAHFALPTLLLLAILFWLALLVWVFLRLLLRPLLSLLLFLLPPPLPLVPLPPHFPSPNSVPLLASTLHEQHQTDVTLPHLAVRNINHTAEK